MIGCLRTHVRKQPIIALYFESENELKLYSLEAGHTHLIFIFICMIGQALDSMMTPT